LFEQFVLDADSAGALPYGQLAVSRSLVGCLPLVNSRVDHPRLDWLKFGQLVVNYTAVGGK
jgi:hypothetical protein